MERTIKMDFGKRPSIVILIYRTRFDFYDDAKQNISHFDLTPFFTNFEAVNKVDFEQQIKSFVEQNGISSGNIIIVIGEDALFVKAIPPDAKEEEEEIQKFVASVPFENVRHISYPVESGKLIVATNKDFYLSIKSGFEKIGFLTSLVIPIFSTNASVDPNVGLDADLAKSILHNSVTLSNISFENFTQEDAAKKETKKTAPQKTDKKRLFLLAAVFGVLISILIFVTLSSQSSETAQTDKSAGNISPSPVLSPIINTTSNQTGTPSSSLTPVLSQ